MGVGCIPSSPPPPPPRLARPASVIASEEERKEGGQLCSLLCEGSRQQQSIALLYLPRIQKSKLDLILFSPPPRFLALTVALKNGGEFFRLQQHAHLGWTRGKKTNSPWD